jgi:hypothetical protein
MTCDDAFDLLTDPARHAEPALQRHLTQCPRCRAMSDTLAPALGVLHAAAAESTAMSEPAEPAPHLVAVSAARRLAQRTSYEPRRLSPTRRLSPAIIGLAGLSTLLLFISLGGLSAPRSAVQEPASTCLYQQRRVQTRASIDPQRVIATCQACHRPQESRIWELLQPLGSERSDPESPAPAVDAAPGPRAAAHRGEPGAPAA